MAKEQLFGIKYPFSTENIRGTFMDLNETETERVQSEMLHIIFTPKGQRLRMPEFGCNVIKYIFEPSDAEAWSQIKNDIKKQVSHYLPNVIFQDIVIVKNQNDDNSVYASITYSVKEGNQTTENKVLIKVI